MLPRFLPMTGLAVLLSCSGCAREEDHVARQNVGDPLGDHAIEDAGGFRLRTSELGPRVLLIHFFDADSAECRAQVAQIKSLWFPIRGAGVNVLGVCPETDAKTVQRTVKEWALPYPVFLDPERRFAGEFAPRKYPWNVVVGRDGRILLTGKGGWDRVQAAVMEATRTKVEGPDHVRVQHILIAFEGSVPGKEIKRSKGDAARLAAEVFGRAKAGEDFRELVKAYTADAVPGIHYLANFNVETEADIDESERGSVVQSFGDVAFSLEVGGIGMAEYHPIKSRFGWHIIKRLG